MWFVDSDDCVTDDALKNIIDAARTEPDVIAINKRTEFKNGTASTESFTEKQLSSCCGSELLKNGCAVNAVLYICSRNFLEVNNLKFYPGIFHEDLEFTPRMLFKAKRITFVNKPLYIVHKHSNSITTTVNPKRAYDYITVANSLRTFVIQNKSAYDKYLYRYVGRAVCNALRVAGECDKNDQNEFIKFFSKDVQNSFVSSLLRTVNWKYMFICCLFMLCPQKSVYIYNRCLKQR